MHILFLTDNFPPETNAAAIRTYDHARVWCQLGHNVTILTGVPNFPMGKIFQGYQNSLSQMEMIDGIRVVRMWTYIAPNQGVLKRTIDFASFMISAIIGGLIVPRPDVVVATSPQFLTAISGWAVAKIKGCPFIFELRDLWPESILAVGAMSGRGVSRLLDLLTRYIYHQADMIISVTESFKTILTGRGVPAGKILVVKNGVNLDRMVPARTEEEICSQHALPEEAFLAGYVGTMGMAHGLATILEAARLTKSDSSLHYILMGAGAERDQLKEQAAGYGLTNITFLDRVPHQEAIHLLSVLDVALVLLKDTPLFETVLPSKIFEAMALGKPIILGVKGESLDLVLEHQCGVGIPPEDSKALVKNIEYLRENSDLCHTMGERGRKAVREQYDRKALAERMLGHIESLFFGSGDGPDRILLYSLK